MARSAADSDVAGPARAPVDGRPLAYAVGCCLAGAGVVLFALSRVWSVQVTARAGLPDLRSAQTGGVQLPWLPAVALVALAGAGALLATRGSARRAVGVLLTVAGTALLVGVLAGRATLEPGAAGAGATLWPVAGALGSVSVVLGGWWAIRRGHRWPTMGARYERPPAARPGTAVSGGAVSEVAVSGRADQDPVDTRVVWDALDRGEDPTDD